MTLPKLAPDVGTTAMPTLAAGGTDWILVLTVMATVAAVVSAAGVLAGLIHWWKKRSQRAQREHRERQMSTDISEMGESIEHLESVVGALAEDARGRRPQPAIRFALADGPSPGAVVLKRAIPVVDVEAVVDSERKAAFATLHPITDAEPTPARTGLAVGRLGIGRTNKEQYLPVTEDDHSKFREEVEKYAAQLRAFIPKWLDYLRARQCLVTVSVQIDNAGGAPADDARIRLRFPDPFTKPTFPTKPKQPVGPKFSPRENPLWTFAHGGGRLGLSVPASLLRTPMPRFDPPNLTGPFYEDGSVLVRFDYNAIRHDDPITDDFAVGVPGPGSWEIPWSVGARNLPRPEEGKLFLEVRYEEPDPVPVITLDAAGLRQ